ncbi:hypothetical protein Rsub_00339 [Raphidocelis subcapitata]|uniref:Patatin n=1 Tax=Raphidocelis subcapitata TaxID=307507 RepID=A0A2V0NK39_9CHLO|nr:hypothetical protein Rsub_00339 [Raphidocelis subcapitata]|eukprot:GBF87628.1 hypothetical protein Rsub_00339 [Raphidocelis subcapitata]
MSQLAFHGVGNSTALQAFESGTLGLSWGGAGFLILWYAGVLKVFQQLGIYKPLNPPRVAGISSGALTSAAICSGTTAEQFHHTVTELLSTCRKKGCAGRMDQRIKEMLDASLPPDAPQRCRGKFFAGVTVVDATSGPRSVMTSVVDGINTRADMIATLAASAYIPLWSGRRLFTTWRGMETADGSLSVDQPCPPGVGYCLRISSRSPDLPKATIAETVTAVARALAGAQPSSAGMAKPRLPKLPPKVPASRIKFLSENGFDIAPGLSIPTHFDSATWTELSLIPCDPDTCDYLYRLGQLDAMAWAEATGILDASKSKGLDKGPGGRGERGP